MQSRPAFAERGPDPVPAKLRIIILDCRDTFDPIVDVISKDRRAASESPEAAGRISADRIREGRHAMIHSRVSALVLFCAAATGFAGAAAG
jgi:hypothetical protein